MNIIPQSIYIIVEAKPDFQRSNEFTLNDQKGNVLSYLERKENMVVMTKEEFIAAIKDAMNYMCTPREYLDNLFKK